MASVSLAHASPPDPSWIPGIYDGHDYDDVVGMATDTTAINDSPARQRVERVFVGFVLRAATGQVSGLAVQRRTIRGPPLDTRDGSVDLLLIGPAPAFQLFNAPSLLRVAALGTRLLSLSCQGD